MEKSMQTYVTVVPSPVRKADTDVAIFLVLTLAIITRVGGTLINVCKYNTKHMYRRLSITGTLNIEEKW